MRSRTPGTVAIGFALTLVLALVGPAVADPDGPDGTVPSEDDVAAAEAAVQTKASAVESVRAELAVAQHRLEQTQVAAIKATEVFNAARFHAHEAAQDARAAQLASDEANADLALQREGYADAVNTSYQLGPSLSPLAALSNADGVSGVLESSTLIDQAAAAIQDTYDSYEATSILAEAAQVRADEAFADAAAAKDEAKEARDEAEAAAQAAEAQTTAYAAERDGLIAELAELENTSVELARERQEALEQAAAEAAALAAQQAAEQAAQEAAEQAAQEAAEQAAQDAADQAAQQAAQDAADEEEPTSPSTPTDPSTPTPPPTPPSDPEDTPDPPPVTSPPAPSGGAGAAIAFARAQIGEPYKYGAAGPSSWDCSGLTMVAWQQGGKSLPHYSAGQYSTATPIGINDLQPGDLLFWGSKPSSIYHVALYVGGGKMIHAPRTGRDVEEVSMYYWITPNFFARP